MAVKYTIPFYDDANVLWRADLDLPAYSGDPIEIVGVGRTFCTIEYGATNEDPFEPIVGSSVALQFYNQNGEVDVRELQLLPDLEGRVRLYRFGELYWSGFILPDGIERLVANNPYNVTLTATDGLTMLDDVPYWYVTNWPMPPGISLRSPLSYVRAILGSQYHLDNPLPIRWTSYVGSSRYCDDAFAGQIEWGDTEEAWLVPGDENRSCLWVLRGLLESLQLRIYQVGGKWAIERVNDVASGEYFWKEITEPRGTGTPVLTTGVINTETEYPFIYENHSMTIKPALTGAEVTYDYTQRDNVLPNGGFEEFIGLTPQYWTMFSNAPVVTYSAQPYEGGSLSDQPGSSVDIRYGASEPAQGVDAVFIMDGRMPVDAHNLYKSFTFGFLILPLNGFRYWLSGPDEGFINWDDEPLQVSISYWAPQPGGQDPIQLYLNEFGFWRRLPLVPQLYMNVSTESFNTIRFFLGGRPMVGQSVTIEYVYSAAGVTTFYGGTYTVSQAEEDNVNLLASNIRAWLTSILTPAGYWTVTGTSSNIYVTNTFSGGTLTNTAGVNLGDAGLTNDGFIRVTVDRMKMGDIASVVFRGRGGNEEILLPDPGIMYPDDFPERGEIRVSFKVKEGQRFVLDDVYMRFNREKEAYISESVSQRKTNMERKTIHVSSSPNGFHVSNMMSRYTSAKLHSIFYDTKYIGNLTGLTANAIMRMRHVPREVFTGDFYVNEAGVGSRNYFPRSNRLVITTSPANATHSNNPDGSITLTHLSGGSAYGTPIVTWLNSAERDAVNSQFEEGEMVTVSIDARSLDSSNPPELYIKPGAGMGYVPMQGVLSEEWSRFTNTRPWVSAGVFSLHLRISSGTVDFRNIKIEKGSSATPWSPAPEDTEPWKFNSIYNIEGKKFLPLNSRYNVEECTVSVTAMEAEDGNPLLLEKHNGKEIYERPETSCQYPPVGTWVGADPACELDNDGFRTGLYGYMQLYNAVLDVYKPNDPSDPDYIAPENRPECDAPVLVSQLAIISNESPYTLTIEGNGQKYRVVLYIPQQGGGRLLPDSYEGTDETHTYNWANEFYPGPKNIEYYGGRENVTRMEFNGLSLSGLNLSGFTNLTHVQLGISTTSAVNSALEDLDTGGAQDGYLSYFGNPDSNAAVAYSSLLSKGWTIDGNPPV